MGWFSSKKEEAPVVDRRLIALNRAANALDLMGLKSALLQGADPNGGDDVSISPLVSATVSIQAWLNNSDERQQDVIIALLDAGARPEWAGRDGKNPYELALRKGWPRVVSKMLEKGADANRLGLAGPTPLQVIFSVGEYKGWPLLPVVEILLSKGADPSLSSKQQPIPLVLGLRNDVLAFAPDIEDVLLELVASGGVPPEISQALVAQANERGMTALAQAIEVAANQSVE